MDKDACQGCARCVEICPANALSMAEGVAFISDEGACSLCGVCADQCPASAVHLPGRVDAAIYRHTTSGIEGYQKLSDDLRGSLRLSKAPVAVRLVGPSEQAPADIRALEAPIRHCVSIQMASLGATIYLPMEMHACSAARAALGMAELPEKVRDGRVPHMHGLAHTQEAAARIMREIPRLPVGSVRGTVVAPLELAPFEPHVVVLTVVPEQAMWIANALLFEDGGPRVSANFAGMQASCSDATAIPHLTGEVNFTPGCYGCRSMGKLGRDEMYAGVPWPRLEGVIKSLKGLRRAMRNLERGSP